MEQRVISVISPSLSVLSVLFHHLYYSREGASLGPHLRLLIDGGLMLTYVSHNPPFCGNREVDWLS
jgi:hypothetical protein